jgi:hypothetical protein
VTRVGARDVSILPPTAHHAITSMHGGYTMRIALLCVQIRDVRRVGGLWMRRIESATSAQLIVCSVLRVSAPHAEHPAAFDASPIATSYASSARETN